VVYILEPAVEAAFRELAAGNPVLVLQNLGLSWYPRWHYALLIGYDINAGTVTLHSGTTQDYLVALSTFDRTWARAGRWGIVITLPDEIPATAQEIPYARAIAQLERRNPATAEQMYLTALRHWPDSLVLLIGLGNTRYAINDLAGARESFSDAMHAHPQSAVAHNNYAYVSMRLGFIDEARVAAERAVELSGTMLPEAKGTLDDILAQ
jgi:tetratricopeptide (TPR) repeat protein